jgi:hypothetical protein
MPLVCVGEAVSIAQKLKRAIPQNVVVENETDQDLEVLQEEDPNGRAPSLKLIIKKR